MEPAILEGNLLKLPERIARRLRGKLIQIMEVEDGVLLRTSHQSISEAKGFLRGKGFSTSQYFEMKEADKELEA